MNRTEFEHLAERYLAGNISPEEQAQLLAHYDALQQNNLDWEDEAMGPRDLVKTELYHKVLEDIAERGTAQPSGRKGPAPLKWLAAAAVLVLVSMVFFFYVKKTPLAPVKNTATDIADVMPGGNKAILTLADGTELSLDDTGEGIVTTQGNIIVNKNKDGQLIYRVTAETEKTAAGKLVYNTIRTPHGGQYQLVLSDQTRVWLNAGSSIKFPTVFAAKERSVTVEGEAYFEVTKDKNRPFKVYAGTQQIEVLGTHFNVNAYKDEAEVKTTLLEGAVKIAYGNSGRILKPGQQARLSAETGKLDLLNVDIEEAVSWKNGYFMFDNEDIHSIMRKISRWYDVEVVFLNEQISERFGGTVSKFENVSQVLKILEVTGTIHFKIEGRRITVM